MSDKLEENLKLRNSLSNTTTEGGFSLIEMLVVGAIIGILAVVSATIISSIIRSQNRTAATNNVRQNGNLVIDRFDRDMKQAKEVSGSGSSLIIKDVNSQDINWDCVPTSGSDGGYFTRNGIALTNKDPVTGTNVADCNVFSISGPVGSQLVKLKFSLGSGKDLSTSDLRVQVDFQSQFAVRSF